MTSSAEAGPNALADGSFSGFIVLEGARVRFASDRAREALGYSPEEMRALTVPELAPALSEAEWRGLLDRLGQGLAPRLETRLRGKGGRDLPVVLQLERMSDGKRTLVHAALQPAEIAPGAASRLDTALLRSVIDTAPDAIVTIDATGLIESFSPAAERMFGYDAAEVIGQNVSLLMPEPYRSEHDAYLERYHRTGQKRIIGIGRTVIAMHKSGRIFPIELAVGEVRGAGSHIYTGFIRDISDRVAAQERAIKLQQELSHVSRLSAMGEITSMIVHEMNQPLTAIANFGEAARRLIERGGPQAHRAAEFIEKAIGQAHRASEMIRRLRTFVSRGSSEMEPIAVNDVVQDAARLALIGAADQQIRTSFDLADDLPAVIADRIQVQQVVVNLIRNAIDAMVEAHSEPSRLRISTAREGGGVQVAVEDTGPGIPLELRDELFTPFVTTKEGGMGIGLSMSQSIVEAHGGRIWYATADGGGSRFAFTLPIEARGREG